MTDRTLTPEVYGDFGLFLDQIGVRERPQPKEIKQPVDRTPRDVSWFARGEECPH